MIGYRDFGSNFVQNTERISGFWTKFRGNWVGFLVNSSPVWERFDYFFPVFVLKPRTSTQIWLSFPTFFSIFPHFLAFLVQKWWKIPFLVRFCGEIDEKCQKWVFGEEVSIFTIWGDFTPTFSEEGNPASVLVIREILIGSRNFASNFVQNPDRVSGFWTKFRANWVGFLVN